MAIPSKELIARDEPQASPIAEIGDSGALFAQLARDPAVSVEKIERLMALWERGEARKAETAFNAAMVDAQSDMRRVGVDAYNSQTKSRYASHAALDKALRPIYTKHGFALSFNTEDGAVVDYVRVVCYVTHRDGHSRTYHVDMPSDGKGAKGGDVMTRTHATGSAMTYGVRYLLKGIFNVAQGEQDDDGNAAGDAHAAVAPDGYDQWADDMEATADEGVEKLRATWGVSKKDFQAFTFKARRTWWEGLKAKAAKKGGSHAA